MISNQLLLEYIFFFLNGWNSAAAMFHMLKCIKTINCIIQAKFEKKNQKSYVVSSTLSSNWIAYGFSFIVLFFPLLLWTQCWFLIRPWCFALQRVRFFFLVFFFADLVSMCVLRRSNCKRYWYYWESRSSTKSNSIVLFSAKFTF